MDHHLPRANIPMSHHHISPSLCSTSSSLEPSTSTIGGQMGPNIIYTPNECQHQLPPPPYLVGPAYNDQNMLASQDMLGTLHPQNTNEKMQQKENVYSKSDTMTEHTLFG